MELFVTQSFTNLPPHYTSVKLRTLAYHKRLTTSLQKKFIQFSLPHYDHTVLQNMEDSTYDYNEPAVNWQLTKKTFIKTDYGNPHHR